MGKYIKNEIVDGCVTGIEKYGIFVVLDEYYSGLIHISEISDEFIKDITKVANIGETIRVRVLDTDDDTFHVKLSIKDLNYRIVNNNKEEKFIPETVNGFKTLEVLLQNWIKERKN